MHIHDILQKYIPKYFTFRLVICNNAQLITRLCKFGAKTLCVADADFKGSQDLARRQIQGRHHNAAPCTFITNIVFSIFEIGLSYHVVEKVYLLCYRLMRS